MSGSSNGLPRAGALPQRVERVTVPWLWLRVLAFGLIAFSFMVLAFRLGGGATDLMAAALYGALPFNLAVLVFFYELYPKRDLSLLFLIFVLLAGGGVSCVLVSLGYAAVDPYPFMNNQWTSLVFTAVWEEFAKAGLDKKVWQYFTVVPDFKSVGMKNNARVFEYMVIIRAINTIDAMTASIEKVDWDVLEKITGRILEEVGNVNRVCYDMSPKPPATIEFE